MVQDICTQILLKLRNIEFSSIVVLESILENRIIHVKNTSVAFLNNDCNVRFLIGINYSSYTTASSNSELMILEKILHIIYRNLDRVIDPCCDLAKKYIGKVPLDIPLPICPWCLSDAQKQSIEENRYDRIIRSL